ncbi:hypothetical protein AYO20_04191 [Fonsecaea nubica]|uniref:Uncharacterized protein n=1 Tax=Fonsecaea nubica TaxID=856822 RepID=A0A178D638_9EURO|nr:hypothetical protein AYO20_04191 [Fonsecaea nubica]OAL36575.1 hypothetical protein AYO20_04191 [Fonsecaea nubica]
MARDSLRLNIPWRKCNVHKSAKHKYNLDLDDVYVYEIGFVGESYQCPRHCARSGCIRPVEEGAGVDSDNPEEVEVGVAEDEFSSMYASTGSSCNPIDEETSDDCDADSRDWASPDGRRVPSLLDSQAIQVDGYDSETPLFSPRSLTSSSSGDLLSVFSSDTVVSRCTAYGEGVSADEDDSRICPRQCLNPDNMEDWSIDGHGYLWPNAILRGCTVTLVERAEPRRR